MLCKVRLDQTLETWKKKLNFWIKNNKNILYNVEKIVLLSGYVKHFNNTISIVELYQGSKKCALFEYVERVKNL